jgi:hypothetical protein
MFPDVIGVLKRHLELRLKSVDTVGLNPVCVDDGTISDFRVLKASSYRRDTVKMERINLRVLRDQGILSISIFSAS